MRKNEASVKSPPAKMPMIRGLSDEHPGAMILWNGDVSEKKGWFFRHISILQM
jgi:hypothetical protein